MFGGKIGVPELLMLAIIALMIAVPVTAVKMKTQAGYFSLGLFFIALMSFSEIYQGFGAVTGSLMLFLSVAALPALIYWGIVGRKSDPGKIRTSKIFFWLAYAIPILAHWSESLSR